MHQWDKYLINNQLTFKSKNDNRILIITLNQRKSTDNCFQCIKNILVYNIKFPVKMFILKIPMNVLNMFCLIMIGTELVSRSDLCKSRADPESPEPPPPHTNEKSTQRQFKHEHAQLNQFSTQIFYILKTVPQI